jgi:hypothetical protein
MGLELPWVILEWFQFSLGFKCRKCLNHGLSPYDVGQF